MEPESKLQQRRAHMANIRLSLSALPVLKQKALQLEVKLEKNRSRKPSCSLAEPELALSHMDSLSIDSDNETTSIFADRYIVGDKIGEGAHGVVKKCFCRETGELRAVKTMSLDR